MNTEDLNLMGKALFALSALAGLTYCILGIREQLFQRPDPRLTFATRGEMESLQGLIQRNGEQIATLVAQTAFYQQQIRELTLRTDTLLERVAALCAQEANGEF